MKRKVLYVILLIIIYAWVEENAWRSSAIEPIGSLWQFVDDLVDIADVADIVVTLILTAIIWILFDKQFKKLDKK